MTDKSVFSDDEWREIVDAPLRATLAMFAAGEHGPISMVKEASASARAIAKPGDRGAASELIAQIAAEAEGKEARHDAKAHHGQSMEAVTDTALDELKPAAAALRKLPTCGGGRGRGLARRHRPRRRRREQRRERAGAGDDRPHRRHVQGDGRDADRRQPPGLRPIERRILRLVDDGVPEVEIAARFRRSPEYVNRVIVLAHLPGRAATSDTDLFELRPIERCVLGWRSRRRVARGDRAAVPPQRRIRRAGGRARAVQALAQLEPTGVSWGRYTRLLTQVRSRSRPRRRARTPRSGRSRPGRGRSGGSRGGRSRRRRTGARSSTSSSAMSGPHGTDFVTCSSVSGSAACSKWVHVGRSCESWPATPAFGQISCTVFFALGLVVGPAQVELRVARPGAARLLERVDELALGRVAPVAVADPAGELGGLGPEAGDDDRDRSRSAGRTGGRSRPRSTSPRWSTVSPVHSWRMTVDGLLEHLPADLRARPAVPEDVLVQRLAGADAEEEPAVEQQRRGRGGLREDRGVDAHDRARHADADLDALGRRRDRAEHRPHERAVALGASTHGW